MAEVGHLMRVRVSPSPNPNPNPHPDQVTNLGHVASKTRPGEGRPWEVLLTYLPSNLRGVVYLLCTYYVLTMYLLGGGGQGVVCLLCTC